MNKWVERRLGDIAIITMGQSPKSDSYNSDGLGIPFLQGNRTFGAKYPTFDTYTTLPNKTADANDVIMSVRAPVGDLNITPVKMCIGRGVCSLKPINGNSLFLYYLLKCSVPIILSRSNGTVYDSINRIDIEKMRVIIPETDAQQTRIANILSAYDDAIENNNRRIALLEKAARELYREWFVRFRFPGSEAVKIVEGVPEGWEVRQLGEIVEFSNGKLRPETTGIIPVYGGNGVLAYCDRSNQTEGIIIGRVGAYCGSVYYERKPHWVSDNAIAAKNKKNSTLDYTYYLLLQLDLNKRQTGTGQPLLTQNLLNKIKIIKPPYSLQVIFSELANKIKIMNDNLQVQSQNLARQRDLLLPRLMTGKQEV